MNYRRYDKVLGKVTPSDVLNVRRDLSGPDVSELGLSPTQPSGNFPKPSGSVQQPSSNFQQRELHQEVLSGWRLLLRVAVDPRKWFNRGDTVTVTYER